MGNKKDGIRRKMKISLKVLISFIQRRMDLIRFVFEQNMTVIKAAKKLELKVCTARSILAKYTKKGQVLDKKMHKKTANSSRKIIHQESDGIHQDLNAITHENSLKTTGNYQLTQGWKVNEVKEEDLEDPSSLSQIVEQGDISEIEEDQEDDIPLVP